MKFALALLAIGAQAVKLHQEEEVQEDPSSWKARADRMHSIVDWDGSGTVDAEEIKVLIAMTAENGYATEDEAEGLFVFADELQEDMGGPFTADQLWAAVEVLMEADDEEALDDLETMEGLLVDAEDMIMNMAIDASFEVMDIDDNDQIEASDIDVIAEVLEMDDDEADEFLEDVMFMDEDEDGAVT